jgi:hypothetical protein
MLEPHTLVGSVCVCAESNIVFTGYHEVPASHKSVEPSHSNIVYACVCAGVCVQVHTYSSTFTGVRTCTCGCMRVRAVCVCADHIMSLRH